MLICGVDEAGRGSMVGPLVIAGVSITHKKIKELDLMGIKDSKKLTPYVREKLYKQIIDFVDDYYVTQINPFTIDRNVRKHQLNALEAKSMAKVILKLSPDISYVDSCDVNATRFGKEISGLTNNRKIRSYHHADSRFVIVSAASILAKVTRDNAIKRLHKQHDLCSGYPSFVIRIKINYLVNFKILLYLLYLLFNNSFWVFCYIYTSSFNNQEQISTSL
ncbi:MAG: ribonuclease HII [Nitrosopumilales archaeon]|nr:ribonuclease HII [Nitrosopumilales archaeon]